MAVAVDSNSGVTADAAGVTTLSLTTFTVGSGANRALVALLGWDNITHTVTGGYPRWDDAGTPQALTAITNAGANSSDSCRADLWGLVAPTSGNKTIKVNWTTAAELIIMLVSFTGVNQTGGSTTFPNGTSATGSSTLSSVVVTSAAGNYTVALANAANSTCEQPVSQTFVASVSGIGADNTCGSIGTGAATVTHTTTVGPTNPWVAVGCNIIVPSAAGDTQEWRGCYPPRKLPTTNISY